MGVAEKGGAEAGSRSSGQTWEAAVAAAVAAVGGGSRAISPHRPSH